MNVASTQAITIVQSNNETERMSMWYGRGDIIFRFWGLFE